jgi:opacity protein-like surface antigen
MQRIRLLAAALSMLVPVRVASLSAQSTLNGGLHFGIMGGETKPVGDLSAYADHDWNAGALLSIGAANSPVSFRLDGQWQQIRGHYFGGALLCVGCPSFSEGTDYRVLDATANVVYSVAIAAPTKLYVIGGMGVYNQRATDISSDVRVNRTRFGINGGAGVSFQLFHVATFVEARYHDIIRGGSFVAFGNAYGGPNTFQFIPINVGVMF